MTVKYQLVSQEGLGLRVGGCLGLFYVDYGVVGLRDPEWIQGELNMLIGLFLRYGLVATVAKSKATTCQKGKLWSSMSKDVVGRRCTGRGSTYHERLRRRITYCGLGCTVTYNNNNGAALYQNLQKAQWK